VTKSSVAQVDVPPGALITFLQKGLEYVGIEEHINEDGTIRDYDGNFSLLAPFICDAVAVKEERKQRKSSNNSSLTSTSSTVQIESGGNNKSTPVASTPSTTETTNAKPATTALIPPAADIRLQ